MRALIVSDIHGNLEALDAVLADARVADRLDEVWCLGDIVGYGPDPGPCVDRLRSLSAQAVAGNHDLAAVGAIGLEQFNPHAAEALRWTASRLTEDQKGYLAKLPVTLERPPFTLVHGSLLDPVWDYVLPQYQTPARLAEVFRMQRTQFCLVGQSHVPLVCAEASLHFASLEEGGWELPTTARLIINPGSLGQPRDGDARASYLLYDEGRRHLQHRRVAYPVSVTQAKIRKAGLPETLAARLEHGA